MFEPKTDRLVYGDLLSPPHGYTLDAAICTTYSLELETLIASLVALGLNEATDTELLRSPINTLHAIERVSRRVVVFCESGQTSIPPVSSSLHLLLEKMIVPVALPDRSGKLDFPSFHAKTWIIRYVSKEDKPLYRFIVLSRNLTFDRSWDLVTTLEGREEAGGKRKVKPLIDFISFLSDTINPKDPDSKLKREVVDNMASTLENVRFMASEMGRPFRDFDILPLGIGESSYNMFEDELFNDKPGHGIHDIVVMTPFLSKGIIRRLDSDSKYLSKSSRRVLITRRPELDKLKGILKNTDVFVMKDAIVDGENELPEEGSSSVSSKQDIHAKAYLSVKDTDVRFLTGSMNASENGLGRNVEMMVRLYTTPSSLNKDLFIKDLMGPDINDKANPFTKIDFESISETENTENSNSAEIALKRLCRLELYGKVTPVDDFYDVTLFCKSGKVPEGITISPLRAQGLSRKLERTIVFPRLRLLELTEFYTVSIGEGTDKIERLIFIPTRGIPQDREKGIITDIISDKRKFAEYVAFVLGDTSEQIMTEMMESRDEDSRSSSGKTNSPLTALYERMLRVACDDPERLKGIGRLVKLIDDDEIVTTEFKKMFKTFMSALKFKYDG